jgi:hypothetical protein
MGEQEEHYEQSNVPGPSSELELEIIRTHFVWPLGLKPHGSQEEQW